MKAIVYGTPIPQGSSKGFPIRRKNGKIGVSITAANPKTHSYRQNIAQTCSVAIQESPETGFPAPRGVGIELSIVFVVAKPQSAPKRVLLPTKKPDLDKLCRSIGDSLTGIWFEDDSQIVSLKATKVFGSPERTEIECHLV